MSGESAVDWEATLKVVTTPEIGLSITSAVGLVLTVFFYIKSKVRTRLHYDKDELRVIGGHEPYFGEELEIRYKGQMVKRVTVTKFYIWNSGTTTVQGSQITKIDPLRILAPETTILLKAVVLRQVRTVTLANVALDQNNSAIISFDFLDPGDGFSIELTHTGVKSELALTGTLMGLSHGIIFHKTDNYVDKIIEKSPLSPAATKIVFQVLFFVCAMFFVFLPLLFPNFSSVGPLGTTLSEQEKRKFFFPLMVSYTFVIPIAFWALFRRRRPYPAQLD